MLETINACSKIAFCGNPEVEILLTSKSGASIFIPFAAAQIVLEKIF
jgi:hypothetical protein